MEDKLHYKKKDKKRLFIALDLPENVKSQLYDITSGLKKRDEAVRPVPAANIHLTLKFLGDISVEKIKKISNALETAALSKQRFNFSLGDRLEAFPNIHNASIIYVPVNKGSDLIEDFFKSLEDSLSKIKIRKEGRKFVSHITVARLKNKKDIAYLVENPGFVKLRELNFGKIALVESKLKPSGAEYTILGEYELKLI